MQQNKSPRPILKRAVSHNSSSSSSPPHAVHFPPSPALVHTFAVHSSSSYDRSPIVVSPNTCALPARGCPGRTYTLDDVPPCPSKNPPRGHPYGGRDLHPRAFAAARMSPIYNEDPYEEAQRTPTRTYYQLPHPPPPPPPPLIPDLSSESDESDGFMSPPPASCLFPPPPPSGHKYPAYHPQYPAFPINPASLAFLPHAPSSQTYTPTHFDDEQRQQKPRRRPERRSRSRSQEREHRMRSAAAVEEDAYEEDDERSYPSSSPKQRNHGYRDAERQKDKDRHRSMSLCKAMSSFAIADDPCLGGF